MIVSYYNQNHWKRRCFEVLNIFFLFFTNIFILIIYKCYHLLYYNFNRVNNTSVSPRIFLNLFTIFMISIMLLRIILAIYRMKILTYTSIHFFFAPFFFSPSPPLSLSLMEKTRRGIQRFKTTESRVRTTPYGSRNLNSETVD